MTESAAEPKRVETKPKESRQSVDGERLVASRMAFARRGCETAIKEILSA